MKISALGLRDRSADSFSPPSSKAYLLYAKDRVLVGFPTRTQNLRAELVSGLIMFPPPGRLHPDQGKRLRRRIPVPPQVLR